MNEEADPKLSYHDVLQCYENREEIKQILTRDKIGARERQIGLSEI